MPSLFIQRRLSWLGHAYCMEPHRLPREILYGELREAIRRVGRPLLRYKGVIKRDLRSALIDTSAWEDIAKHRDAWRQSVKAGVLKVETNKSRLHARQWREKNTQPLCVFPQGTSAPPATETALQDRATKSYKIVPKSSALTIAFSRRGCHYYY